MNNMGREEGGIVKEGEQKCPSNLRILKRQS
jgi:hypothetical protein